jgi:hypothetical protein
MQWEGWHGVSRALVAEQLCAVVGDGRAAAPRPYEQLELVLSLQLARTRQVEEEACGRDPIGSAVRDAEQREPAHSEGSIAARASAPRSALVARCEGSITRRASAPQCISTAVRGLDRSTRISATFPSPGFERLRGYGEKLEPGRVASGSSPNQRAIGTTAPTIAGSTATGIWPVPATWHGSRVGGLAGACHVATAWVQGRCAG